MSAYKKIKKCENIETKHRTNRSMTHMQTNKQTNKINDDTSKSA